MVNLDDTCRREIFDQGGLWTASVCRRENHFQLSGLWNIQLKIIVNVTVGMASDGDRFFPGGNAGFDVIHENGFSENGSIQHGTDCSVGAFPGFFQMVFFYAVFIGRDGRAFNSNSVFHNGAGCINGDLIIRIIPVFDVKIVIIDVHVQVGKKQLVLDHLPHDAGHFVSVHFDESCFYFNFVCHVLPLLHYYLLTAADVERASGQDHLFLAR